MLKAELARMSGSESTIAKTYTCYSHPTIFTISEYLSISQLEVTHSPVTNIVDHQAANSLLGTVQLTN